MAAIYSDTAKDRFPPKTDIPIHNQSNSHFIICFDKC